MLTTVPVSVGPVGSSPKVGVGSGVGVGRRVGRSVALGVGSSVGSSVAASVGSTVARGLGDDIGEEPVDRPDAPIGIDSPTRINAANPMVPAKRIGVARAKLGMRASCGRSARRPTVSGRFQARRTRPMTPTTTNGAMAFTTYSSTPSTTRYRTMRFMRVVESPGSLS
jgi:hypothetical protein